MFQNILNETNWIIEIVFQDFIVQEMMDPTVSICHLGMIKSVVWKKKQR